MINFEFVVFANSFKNKFHCVAGKTTNNKKWIRPVSNKNGGELNHEQIKYKNQYGIFSVKTLQIINLYLDEHEPHFCHRRLVAEYLNEKGFNLKIKHLY